MHTYIFMQEEQSGEVIGYSETKLLIKLTKVHHTKNVIAKQLAQECNISNTNPYFQKIIQLLIQKNIIQVVKIVGQSKLLILDVSKLVDYIDNLPITNEWYDYFKEHHIISW